MNKADYYQQLQNPYNKDYGVYLNVKELYKCQKDFDKLCNPDELQFQIVHQVEELWMKLIIYTLLDVHEALEKQATPKVISLLDRVHKLQKLMRQQLETLHTMSPKDYQTIRLQLGNGSGQESPGFRLLITMPAPIWTAYKKHYLDNKKLTIKSIYADNYQHCESYLVAESLFTFDYLFTSFLTEHIALIHRSIGASAKSLKGRAIDLLTARTNQHFFPQLWTIRSKMTEKWGSSYGATRNPIHNSMDKKQ